MDERELYNQKTQIRPAEGVAKVEVKAKAAPKASTVPLKPPPPPAPPKKPVSHKGSSKQAEEEAKEEMRKIDYDLEGTASVLPSPDFSNKIKARDLVAFQGMGVNFSANYFVTNVVHTINRSGYFMEIEVLRKNFEWKVATDNTKKVAPKKEKSTGSSYTVKKGDTLWAIAKRYYGNGALYPKIFNANRDKIKDPHWIYPKQVLTIPPK